MSAQGTPNAAGKTAGVSQGTAKETPKGAWTVTFLLFLFMVVNFADKIVVGLAGVPIMTDLKLEPEQFGLLGSSFFFLFSISAIVVGFIVNKVATRWVLLTLAVIWALAQFPMVGTVSFTTLLICRIVLGAGEGPAASRSAMHADLQMVPRREAHAADRDPVAGLGLRRHPRRAGAELGHRQSFLALCLRRARRGRPDLGLRLARASARKARSRTPGSSRPLRRKFPTSSFSPRAPSSAAWPRPSAPIGRCRSGLTWFTAFIVKGLGFSQSEAGWISILPWVFGATIVILTGWISQVMMARGYTTRISRGVLGSVPLIIGGLILATMPYVPGVGLKIVMLVVGPGLCGAIYVVCPPMLGEFTPASQRGAILAIYGALYTLSGIIAPNVMGTVIQRAGSMVDGYMTGFTINAVIMVGSGVSACCCSGRTRKRPG